MPSHILQEAVSGEYTRVLPDTMQANIDTASWEWPAIFKWLQEQGNVTTHEMYRTFNCGVGLMIALPQEKVSEALSILSAHGETAWQIGTISSKTGDASVVM